MNLGEWPKSQSIDDKDGLVADKLRDLLDKKDYEYIVKNLEEFPGSNHKEIALKLIEAEQGNYLAAYLEKFSDLGKEIALKLIELGEGRSVVET